MARLVKLQKLTSTAGILAAVEAALASETTEPVKKDVISLPEFERCVRDRAFLDDDGFGYLVVDGRRLPDSNTYLADRAILIDAAHYAMIRTLRRALNDRAAVEWVNR